MKRRKYIGRAIKDYLKSFTSKIISVDEENLIGHASYIQVEEVNRPFIVGEKGAEICLANNGYSELSFLPKDEYWRLCAIYDNHGKIVEWYIDITRENGVDEEGNPYFDDLYLDLVVKPEGEILVLDEDELLEARENGNITADEYNMAYRVKDDLIERKVVDVGYLEHLCSILMSLFVTPYESEKITSPTDLTRR